MRVESATPLLAWMAHVRLMHTILLVDDDQSTLDTFARTLRLDGYSVRTASNPEAGLSEAAASHPDAIIVDLRMPMMSGLEFLRRLRESGDNRQTPVAIVTGDYFIDDDTSRELSELGAELKFKPLWIDDVVEVAQRLVSRLAH